MIPKIIHYCWFGGKPLPRNAKNYIESWKKNLPDFEIIEWNESNSNIDICQFCREAYNNSCFAYVSDVIRLVALYEHGGVYLDTDVQSLKPIDEFLECDAFVSFENEALLGTGVIGAKKGSEFIKDFLEIYKSKKFSNNTRDSSLTNTVIAKEILEKKGIVFNNKRQQIKDYIDIYPSEYFSAKNSHTGIVRITKNTFFIHHFAASWFTPRQQFNYRVSLVLHKLGLWKFFAYLSGKK